MLPQRSASRTTTTTTTTRQKKKKKKPQTPKHVYRSTLGALVAVVAAIFVPVHADAEAAEIVSALEDDRVLEEVQADGAGQLLPHVVAGRRGRGHLVVGSFATRRPGDERQSKKKKQYTNTTGSR